MIIIDDFLLKLDPYGLYSVWNCKVNSRSKNILQFTHLIFQLQFYFGMRENRLEVLKENTQRIRAGLKIQPSGSCSYARNIDLLIYTVADKFNLPKLVIAVAAYGLLTTLGSCLGE